MDLIAVRPDRIDRNLKAVASNLHNRTVGTSVQAHKSGYTHQSFATHHSHFHSLALSRGNNNGNQTVIRKVNEFQPASGLMEPGAAGKALETQVWAQLLKLLVRQRKENAVADGLSLPVGALAREQNPHFLVAVG